MRNAYDVIKKKFFDYVKDWQNHNVDNLEKYVSKDIHGYYSVVNNEQPVGLETAGVKSEPDGAQHSIFGVRDFFLDTPITEKQEYEICNYVCQMCENKAQQASEISVNAYLNGKVFKYVAIFANTWKLINEEWLITETHMDLKHEDGPLKEYFAKSWFFEDPMAVLTKTVHLPCIFPELDSPYFAISNAEDVLTEEEKVEECFSKYCYGIDWINFKDVKATLNDNFPKKREYIANKKFERQSYRYSSNAYSFDKLRIDKNLATAIVHTIVPNKMTKKVSFIKNQNWSITSIEDIKGEN